MIRTLIRFQNMDRRWIFLGMALHDCDPLLFPISFPFKVDERVEAIYDRIEELEAGDTVFISADFDPASRRARALLPRKPPPPLCQRHQDCHRQPVALCPPMVNPWLEEIAADHGKKDGEDFVFLGFKDGKSWPSSSLQTMSSKPFPRT